MQVGGHRGGRVGRCGHLWCLGTGRRGRGPEACQVGRLCEQLWKKNDIDVAAIKNNTAYSSMTVNELGLKVQTNSVDAAIVWDAVAGLFARDVDVVAIPPGQNILSHVAIGLLKYSTNKPLAERFMDFLAADEGREIFKRHGYNVDKPAGVGG